MSGASITLTNINTNAVRRRRTTEAGVYTFSVCSPGPVYAEDGSYRVSRPGSANHSRFRYNKWCVSMSCFRWDRPARRSKSPQVLLCCRPRLQRSAR